MARRRLAAARGIVINGPRQCGKTELMRALHRETGGTLLSLDDTATVTAALADPGGLVTGFPVLLYIDEVQRGGDPLILAVKAMLDASRAKGQIVMSAFLTDPDDGIFRGPYLRVRTPFVAVEESWRSPLEWLPDGFRPYEHQARAFDRLSTVGGRTAEPTLVTTGVSPGCGRAVHRRERHAFVDGRDHLVDRREALRDDPPDILLTNYKMLDFLLLCREDRNLWACNESDTLRYVVLFEFRTYDGAQGTDVAMLLRRLGVTLGMSTADQPLGATVPVATSATLGSGAGALDELRQFAGKVCGNGRGTHAANAFEH